MAAISEELLKLKRTKKTGIITNIKVTHCPACDQEVKYKSAKEDKTCFLCHQPTDVNSLPYEGRIDFEILQLETEKEELNDIISELNRDLNSLNYRLDKNREQIDYVDRNIAPLKNSLYALTNEEVSELDVHRGRIQEQIQNLRRLISNVKYKDELNREILALERSIKIKINLVEAKTNEVDFNSIADDLAEGMQSYVDRVSALRTDIWSEKGKISITINDSRVAFYVNNKPWDVLGKLDKDIFLLAYHFGMLTLTSKKGYRYPGLVIIDLPADLGEAQLDSYNYIIAPFAQYCNGLKDKKPLQVIITGKSFEGLTEVNLIKLTKNW